MEGEGDWRKNRNLEIVQRPTLHAGGSGQLAAFKCLPGILIRSEAEFITAQAGMDIETTAIGMHLMARQIPVHGNFT